MTLTQSEQPPATAEPSLKTSQYKERDAAMQQLIPAIAGAGAGIVCSVLCSPLDVAKIRIQVQGAVFGIPPKYDGVVPTLRTIWREEGVRGMYRGLVPALFCIPLFWGIYFGVYERSKAVYRAHTGSDQHMLAAVSAGAVTDVVTNPFWVVRTRMQTQVLHGAGRPLGMFETVQSIYKLEGISTFYRGLGASLLGLAHVGIQFPVYERLKSQARARRGGSEQPVDLMAASAVSKVTGSVLTYPHEVLRARMQDERLPDGQRRGLVGTVRDIVSREGYAALYTGFKVNMVRVVPSCVATFVSYELFSRGLKDWWKSAA